MRRYDIKRPMEEPTRPAMLHPPWKDAIIGLSYILSILTPCVLTDILQKLPKKPDTIKQSINEYSLDEMPIVTSEMMYPKIAIGNILLLPNLDTNNPDNVMPQICPIGIINKIVPHAASSSDSEFFISGIRLAQLEKQIP